MNYLSIGNEYHVYDGFACKWFKVNEYGERTDEIIYGPAGASAILANGHATLVDVKDVKFKKRDYWPKAWIWSANSFFYQKDEKAPLIFMHYGSDYNPDEIYPVLPKWSPINDTLDNLPCDYNKFGIQGYKKDTILVKKENMPKFMDELKKGSLKNWILSSGKITQ